MLPGLLRSMYPRQNLLTNGMNPIEDIEVYNGRSCERMRWCGDADATIVSLGDGPEPYRSSGEVEGEFFELLWFIVKDELACPAVALAKEGPSEAEKRPIRTIPLQQLVHEILRDARPGEDVLEASFGSYLRCP